MALILNKKIHRKSIGYSILSVVVGFFFRYVFYKNMEVRGLQNIPANKPIIFAPNHNAALMDALSVIIASRRQVVFLARADIFRKPLVARILGMMKVLPVFRLHDGVEQLKQNDEIFNMSVDVIKNRTPLTIFPEATNNNRHTIRPLKKAIPRIAFQSEEINNWELDIQIIPIGLNYTHFWYFRVPFMVQFGEPISVGKYREAYIANPQKAMLQLRDKISAGIKQLVIDIQDKEHYHNYMLMFDLYEQKMLKHLQLTPTEYNKHLAKQAIVKAINKLPDTDERTSFHDKAREVYRTAKQLKMPARYFLRTKKFHPLKMAAHYLMLAVLLPVFVYGFVANAIYLGINYLARKSVKDYMFHSSYSFVLGLLLLPPLYLAQTAVLYLFVCNIWLLFALLLSMPLGGLMAFKYHRSYQCAAQHYRYNKAYKQQTATHEASNYLCEIMNSEQ